jgi:hypothetical protein
MQNGTKQVQNFQQKNVSSKNFEFVDEKISGL